MKRSLLFALVSVLFVSLLLAACSGGTTEKQVVRVATDATWPPFEFVDEATKEISGFDIELMNAVAEKAGFEIEWINIGFDPIITGMAQCTYDAAISAITVTDERKAAFAFSDPYIAAGQVVTVQAGNTDITGKDGLAGKTLGVQLGTTGEIEGQTIVAEQGATMKTYDDVGLAFQDLINGQIDAVIADNLLAIEYIGKNPDKLKTAGAVFTDEFYAIAVCKTNTDLVKQINDGLAAVKQEGLLDQLTTKWIVGQ
jgi:polar amino acid transport system substrate-binding protein